MQRVYHRWDSPALGRPMELLVFGHAGARVVVFPTSMGRFFEWEDRGMVGALAELTGLSAALALLVAAALVPVLLAGRALGQSSLR